MLWLHFLCPSAETSMVRLIQTRMKTHHANSIRLIKNKLFTDEKPLSIGLKKHCGCRGTGYVGSTGKCCVLPQNCH
jgi:hypothetical protein